jgi:hypothetical protein
MGDLSNDISLILNSVRWSRETEAHLYLYTGKEVYQHSERLVVRLDVILDETREYEGEIPNPNAIDSLIDAQIQIDTFVDQTIEPAHAYNRTTEYEDETMTKGDDHVNPNAADDFPILDA